MLCNDLEGGDEVLGKEAQGGGDTETNKTL